MHFLSRSSCLLPSIRKAGLDASSVASLCHELQVDLLRGASVYTFGGQVSAMLWQLGTVLCTHGVTAFKVFDVLRYQKAGMTAKLLLVLRIWTSAVGEILEARPLLTGMAEGTLNACSSSL